MAAVPPSDLSVAKALIDLEQVDERRFRSRYNQDNHLGIIFGGQPLGQALAAAQKTVAEWPAHSLSAYWLKTGVLAEPVDYEVEIMRDGRRFAFRRVVATQRGRPIFDMLCSFQEPETGFEHQFGDFADVPEPETLRDVRDFVEDHADQFSPFMVEMQRKGFPVQLRLLDPEHSFFSTPEKPARDFWFRMPSAQGIHDPASHHALLAFMSDYWFAGAAGMVHFSHGTPDRISFASLNHGLWLHGPVRVDEWLLYRTESPWAASGRGLARGLIYNRDRELVATVVQEVAMRSVGEQEG